MRLIRYRRGQVRCNKLQFEKEVIKMLKVSIIIGLTAAVVWGQEETPDRRLRHSANVLQEIMSAPDKGIPHDLFERARCVIVVPGLKKGAFVFGADYGRGF